MKSVITLNKCKVNLKTTTAILFGLIIQKKEFKTTSRLLKLIKKNKIKKTKSLPVEQDILKRISY